MPASRAGAAGATCATYDLRYLTFRATVRGPRPIVQAVRSLYPASPAWLAGDAPTTTTIAVRPHPSPDDSRAVLISGPGGPPRLVPGRYAVSTCEWLLNVAAAEALGERFVLLHAGSVALRGRGMILPADAGSGKTTLVAGLMAAGFRYLSDDVAVIGGSRGALFPFVKSLFVKAGSREVLAPLFPELAATPPHRRASGERAWYLHPRVGSWPSGPVPIRYVVCPEFVRGAETALTPIARGDAMIKLLEQSFNVQRRGVDAVSLLAEVVRSADCYALVLGDLAAAVHLLRRLAR